MLPSPSDPADDFGLGYEREDEQPEVLASTQADVDAGRRFAGAVYREDRSAPDARDTELEHVEDFAEDMPGSRQGVLAAHGAGTYRVRAFPEAGQSVGRRFIFTVGERQGSRQSASPAPPVRTSPEVTTADIESIREEEARKARSKIQWEKEDLEREVAREKREKGDALDALERSKATLAQAQSDALMLSQRLATSQDEATKARRDLADLSLTHAQTIAELRAAHSDELDELRAEVQESRADARIRDFQLDAARRGEGLPESNPLMDVVRELAPHAGGLFSGLAAHLAAQPNGGAQPSAPETDHPADSGGFADGFAMPYTPSAAPTLPPAPMPVPMPTPGAYSGDGSAGLPAVPVAPVGGDGAAGLDARSFQNPAVSTAVERPELADAATLDPAGAPGPLVTIADAVLSVMRGAASVSPAEIAQLVTRGQAAGAEAADWRELVSDLITEAVRTKAAPEPLADLLAPLARPFGDQLARVLAMPEALAVPLVMHEIGVEVPRGGKAYLGRFLTALKARL